LTLSFAVINYKNKRTFVFNSLKKVLKIIIFATGCIFLLLPPGGMAFGEPSRDISWLSLETRHTIISYQSLEDLEKFNRKVEYFPGEWGITRLFFRSASDNLEDEITKKVDAIYERVQEILDMRKRTKKVTINIYSDEKQLQGTFLKLRETAFRNYNTSSRIRAWYIHKNNTIYLNNDGLHEGMLAHEIAHSIIDHYLLIRPPRISAEILAQYVEKHLLE